VVVAMVMMFVVLVAAVLFLMDLQEIEARRQKKESSTE
jgi:hypothetical protein